MPRRRLNVGACVLVAALTTVGCGDEGPDPIDSIAERYASDTLLAAGFVLDAEDPRVGCVADELRAALPDEQLQRFANAELALTDLDIPTRRVLVDVAIRCAPTEGLPDPG